MPTMYFVTASSGELFGTEFSLTVSEVVMDRHGRKRSGRELHRWGVSFESADEAADAVFEYLDVLPRKLRKLRHRWEVPERVVPNLDGGYVVLECLVM